MRKQKFFWIGFLAALALMWPWIPPQDPPGYFTFVDDRSFWGIPCAWNVLSNLCFLIVGGIGLQFSLKDSQPKVDRFFRFVISLASIWVAFGSAYFHWNPLVSTVFWDRWPMTLAFSAIIGWLLTDKTSEFAGYTAFGALTIASSLGLIFWKWGLVDLKFYFVLQYGGLTLLLILLLFFPKNRLSHSRFLGALGFYILAKLLELGDGKIFEWTGVISGHTLKHFVAGLTLWILLVGSMETLRSQTEK